MRQENLTVIKAGLSRQRTKGAALKDTLYDLLNGYVTTEKTVRVRPGTLLVETLPAGTFGLVSHDGLFQIFASSNVGGIPAGYNLNILRAPNGEDLAKIHFAAPFLGTLYIAAEFADGGIYHFWLRTSSEWAANTAYAFNELVQPTTPDSFVYRATRNGEANALWTEGAPRAVSDKVEPTTANGFYFEVSQIFGPNAISGVVEPDWDDAVDGELFNENVDGTELPSSAAPPPPAPDDEVPADVEDRYGGRTIGGHTKREGRNQLN